MDAGRINDIQRLVQQFRTGQLPASKLDKTLEQHGIARDEFMYAFTQDTAELTLRPAHENLGAGQAGAQKARRESPTTRAARTPQAGNPKFITDLSSDTTPASTGNRTSVPGVAGLNDQGLESLRRFATQGLLTGI